MRTYSKREEALIKKEKKKRNEKARESAKRRSEFEAVRGSMGTFLKSKESVQQSGHCGGETQTQTQLLHPC